MATPGDLSSKKVKNSYRPIVQHDGATSKLYDGTGSRIDSIDVTRITASKASIANITDLDHLTASKVQVDTHLSVSGSSVFGNDCGTDKVEIHGNTWVSGALTVSGSCQSSFRSVGQAKFIYLDNPGIEDQKPAKVTRGMVRGQYNVPRFGGENAALDVYGNAVISGSLIVQDTVFAQEFHSETVSQSIVYTSGSTKFGGDFDDTMTVTGSIFQSGSDAYFLNGVGIGTTGSLKAGTFDEPGQDNPVNFTHLLRIDDPGHNGLQYKNGKLIYGTFGIAGQKGQSHVSSSDTVRFRDKGIGDDVFVISAISQSVFFSTNDKYNIGIGVPSGSNSQVDENLVVSSSANARIKIESADSRTSASLYLESGAGVWELAVQSGSQPGGGASGNQLSESLVFRTNNSRNIINTFGANSTYTEALRLNNRGRAGFNLPSANLYDYPQQVQVSGSLNIIQGRTRDINAGTFHDSDGINGIFFNNQKLIHVSGSGAETNYYYGYLAGNSGTSTSAISNIGIGYRPLKALTTGDYNIALGYEAGFALNSGNNNVILGLQAAKSFTDNLDNVAIGTQAMFTSNGDGDKNIAIGYQAMKLGDVSNNSNIAIGTNALEDLTSGYANIGIGTAAATNISTGYRNVAVGALAMGVGVVTGYDNVAIGTGALEDITVTSGSIAIGHSAARQHTTGNANIAIGSGSMGKGIAAVGGGDGNIALGSYALEDLTLGSGNVAIGLRAMDELTTGEHNIAIGQLAMSAGVTTGDANIAIGYLALKDAVGAHNNIAIGFRAMRDAANTAARNVVLGYQAAFEGLMTGTDNVILGTNAAENGTSLTRNVIIGDDAARDGTITGKQNIIIGVSGSSKITSGRDNISLGSFAGSALTTGKRNILIGSSSVVAGTADHQVVIGTNASANSANSIAIGQSATVTQANSMVLGSQTGEAFFIGMGGLQAPKATLDVSGSVFVTGSLTVSASNTLKNIGRTVLVANERANSVNVPSLPSNRALEVSGTANFNGNAFITGNLFVSDIIVAQEFHTEFVSASITFTSGSNKMGDTHDDLQMMTGSLRVSGSGPHSFVGRRAAPGSGADEADLAKVGINTYAPTYNLDVVGNIGMGSGSSVAHINKASYLYHNDDTNTYLQYQKDRAALSAGGFVIAITGSGASNNEFLVNDGAHPMNMRVNGFGHAGSLDESYLLFVSGGAEITENNATQQRGAVGIRTANPSKALTVSGSISASNDVLVQGDISSSGARFTGNVSQSGTHFIVNALTASAGIRTDGDVTLRNITGSGNISMSGFISSSMFNGPSASFGNLVVTGTVGGTSYGTASIGRINVDRVVIHNHEIVSGDGLSVIGSNTSLGPLNGDDSSLAHRITMQGHITASGIIWASGSENAAGTSLAKGKISASNIVATTLEMNHITSSHMSMSGDLVVRNITASGEISSSSTGSFGALFVNPKASAPSGLDTDIGITLAEFKGDSDSLVIKNTYADGDYYVGNSNNQNGHVYRDGLGGVITLYNDLIGTQTTEEGTYIQKPTAPTGTGNKMAGVGNALQVEGRISSSGVLIVNQGQVSIRQGHVTMSGNITGSSTSSLMIGHITASGGVSSSGIIFTQTNLVAQANISASGNISGSGLYSRNNISASANIIGKQITASSTIIAYGDMIASGSTLIVSRSVAASGSIMSRNYRSIYINAGGMTPSDTNGADTGFEEVAAGADFHTVDFLAFDSATDEYANFQFTMPSEWDRSAIRAKFYYKLTPGTAGSGEKIKFGINGIAVGNDEEMNATAATFELIEDTSLNSTTKLHVSPVTADFNITNAQDLDPHDLVMFRIKRDTSVGSDYTNDARLLGVALQYQERVVAESKWV